MTPKPHSGKPGNPFKRLPFPSANRLDRLWGYGIIHLAAFTDSYRRLRQAPFASLLTILVIGIALALPASFHALMMNAQEPIASLKETRGISLFLKPDLSDAQALELGRKLDRNPEIEQTRLITKEEGLRDLAAYSGFGKALEALESNPLPAVIEIHPRESEAGATARLLETLRSLPEADRVQFDTEWLRKLKALLTILNRSVEAFSLLLGIGVLFIVGNTIRLELQNRHEEIAIAKLLGATHRFIRRPFLYAGFWYAFWGACLAWLLTNALILSIRSPAIELAELYGSHFDLAFLGFAETLRLIGLAIILGITGAWVVVTHFLRRLEPR